MGMFDSLDTGKDIKEDGDSLGGGFGPVDSALYDCKVKHAYTSVSKGGALAVNLVLVTATGKEIRDQQWIASGNEKGNKNTYTKQDGTKHFLPGFNAINSLCLLAAKKGLAEMADPINKTIMLYSYDAQKEVPTEVGMIAELLDTDITAGIIKTIVDKRKANDAGVYEATGETRKINEVDKYFRQADGLTVTEIKAGVTESVFKQKWADKWEGKTKEDFDEDAVKRFKETGGTEGAPTAGGADAPKTSLFG